jgi:hypothetical protein
MTDDHKDRFWGFTNVLKYAEDEGVDGGTSYDCLIE